MVRLILRIAGAAALAYALWLAASVSIASAYATSSPPLALSLRPDHAAANSRVAEMALSERLTPQNLATAEAASRRALERDLTQSRAYRSLALVKLARGEVPAGERLMLEVFRWTRRDLANQLYLIEMQVRRDDIRAALRHYAIALTVRPDSKEILFPILIQAVQQPHLVEPIADFLARESAWRHELLFRMAGEARPTGHADRLIQLVRRKSGNVDLDVVRELLKSLVSAGEYQRASRHAALAVGGRPALVRNGAFSAPSRVEPFDWALANSASARSDITAGNGAPGAGGLNFEYADTQPNTLAKQLLVLAPGRYRLSTRFGLDAGQGGVGPAWTLRCVDGGPLASLTLTAQGRPATANGAAEFQVPAGCRAQWLELGNRGETNASWISGTIANVAIEPVRGG